MPLLTELKPGIGGVGLTINMPLLAELKKVRPCAHTSGTTGAEFDQVRFEAKYFI
jgi:hypothetical protein